MFIIVHTSKHDVEDASAGSRTSLVTTWTTSGYASTPSATRRRRKLGGHVRRPREGSEPGAAPLVVEPHPGTRREASATHPRSVLVPRRGRGREARGGVWRQRAQGSRLPHGEELDASQKPTESQPGCASPVVAGPSCRRLLLQLTASGDLGRRRREYGERRIQRRRESRLRPGVRRRNVPLRRRVRRSLDGPGQLRRLLARVRQHGPVLRRAMLRKAPRRRRVHHLATLRLLRRAELRADQR